jgi:aryl-alcohol dehydrogenase-like predicted oxidoreductase
MPQLRGAVVRSHTASVGHNFHPPDLRRPVEDSRRRLGLDRLDGLLLRSPSLPMLYGPEIHDFLAELLHSGRAAHVGTSVESLSEVEAALSCRCRFGPEGACGSSHRTTIEHIRQRNIGGLVREILASQIRGTWSPGEAISVAIIPDFLTAAIVGVSTRRHLNERIVVGARDLCRR